MLAIPVLAVVYPACWCSVIAAGLDGFRGSAARQMGELTPASHRFKGLCRTPVARVCHHRMLPSQANAAVSGADLCQAAASNTVGADKPPHAGSWPQSAWAVLCATATDATLTGRRAIRA